MSKDYEEIWAEIRLMKEHIRLLGVRRDELLKAHAQLVELADSLQTQAEKAVRVAEEVHQLIEGEEQ